MDMRAFASCVLALWFKLVHLAEGQWEELGNSGKKANDGG